MRRASLVIGLVDGLGGGTEQHVLALCQGLPARGIEPEVVCVVDHPFLATGPFPCETRALTRGTRWIWRGQAVRALARHWERTRPAAAVAFFDNALVAAVGAARGRGGPPVLAARRNMGTERSGRAWREVRALDREVALFVCNSEAVRASVVEHEGVEAARTRVLYNGLDLKLPAALDVRARLGIAPSELLVGCVSGLRPVKGVDRFLEGLARVRQARPGIHAVVIGDGPQRESLEVRASRSDLEGHVHFLGWQEDPRAWLLGCDLAVLSSHSEGFSNAVVEYLACGLPCVLTRVGGNAEAVREGVDGFLVASGDLDALAARLGQLAEDPELRARMGQSARVRALDQFDRERMLDGMAGFLLEVMGA